MSTFSNANKKYAFHELPNEVTLSIFNEARLPKVRFLYEDELQVDYQVSPGGLHLELTNSAGSQRFDVLFTAQGKDIALRYHLYPVFEKDILTLYPMSEWPSDNIQIDKKMTNFVEEVQSQCAVTFAYAHYDIGSKTAHVGLNDESEVERFKSHSAFSEAQVTRDFQKNYSVTFPNEVIDSVFLVENLEEDWSGVLSGTKILQES